MLKLLILLALAPGGALPENKTLSADRGIGATAVTDKFMLPSRPPDCKNEVEEQKAVAQVRNGEPGDCFVRNLRAFHHYKG